MPAHSKKIVFASIPLLLTWLTACSSSPHDPAEKYVLVAASTKVPYWQTAAAGLHRAAAELAVKSDLQGPDGHDAQAEEADLKRAIAEKPAGILVSVADATLLTPDINAAVDQGIPVITVDSDAPDSKRLFFIGTNNYEAGMLGGKVLVKLLNGKGNVVVFKLPGQPNQSSRLSGYTAAFEGHPDLKVSQAIDLQDQPDRASFAFDTTKRLLDAKTKVDAFVCLESRSCGGVADAVGRAKMADKISVVAMDTDPEILDWLQKGGISATIAQKPFTMAYYGTKLLADLHLHPVTTPVSVLTASQNSPLPSFVDTGSFIVDKNNVADFLKQSKTEGQ